jgi:anti-sigma B factor antagonist
MAELEDEPPALQIETHLDHSGAQVVVLSGELDSSSAASLQERMATIAPRPAQRLIFDLASLRFMDSAGIAVLLGAAETGSSVSLRSPSPIIRRVLEITGLFDVFTIEP